MFRNTILSSVMRIRQGDYSEVVTISGNGEIGALAESIDLMRSGIEAREKEILRLAYEDGLTGLPNRAMFHDRLGNAIKLAKRTNLRFSILMMDLDRFKFVNDTLGHHVGDQVLSEVGKRLRTIVRESDTVARLGGDEFAVLLQNTNPSHLGATVQKILHALEKPMVCEGHTLDVGTSIGIANYPDHGENPNLLLQRADMAMYVAKRTKSGYAIFDQTHDEHRQEHLSMLSELRYAIEHDQLRLYYQPKINLKRARVTGVEALLRWEHPTRGIVPPNDFIPFAEQTGFIRELTKWAIGRALRDAQAWAADGISLCVSVNVSTRDLLSSDLMEMLRNWLNAYGVPAQNVCLEITESALMEDANVAQKTLTQLHELGVKLSIDDYGTGYASLGYLKNFPVDEIKIDRVFVKNMATSRTDAAIVRSTIELAHELGLVVVAEGVEKQEDFDLLEQRDCDVIQGYLISRPLPVQDFIHWWKQSEWGARAAPEARRQLHAA